MVLHTWPMLLGNLKIWEYRLVEPFGIVAASKKGVSLGTLQLWIFGACR